ncbi:META domain-containing protein [Hymenobacter sediminis]|uniref:META domain-containing protein n=1 Tax=Hymenobacter sediminis TaxID=2218621 RepID=UPI00139035C5|nr:META domain-containing protein [Hymenobacter sediminis]
MSPTSPTPAATANPSGTSIAALRGTHWNLLQLEGQPIAATPEKQIYLQLNPTEDSAEGQAGCNRFRGSFTLSGADQLQFGALLSTRMACPDLTTETAFLSALRNSRRYRISADTLYLQGESTATPLATLQAQKQ